MRKIKVTVAKDGTTRIEAFGFSGKECLSATKAIEDAIGAVNSRKAKPEMGSVSATQNVVQES